MSFESWMMVAALIPAAVLLAVFIAAVVLLFAKPETERDLKQKCERLTREAEGLEREVTSLKARLADLKRG